MPNKLYALFAVILSTLVLASCSGSHSADPDPDPAESMVKLRMVLQLPATSGQTRVGDPGSPTGEADNWDTFLIIFAYADGTQPASAKGPVVAYRLSKQDFMKLKRYDGDSDLSDPTAMRLYDVQLNEGDVYCYGVVCATAGGEANAPRLEDFKAMMSYKDVDNSLISNSYAAGDADRTAKFLSVATGYYCDPEDATFTRRGTLHLAHMSDDVSPTFTLPVMRLHRLAAKIDIQWDAQQAATGGVTARVDGFIYNGGSATAGSGDPGSGRLFPKLATATEPAGGTTNFYNTTEVSRRNGRVYHYVFPDADTAKPLPTLTFTLSGTNTKDNTTLQSQATLRFQSQPLSGTWYKINATVKNISGTDYQLDMNFTGTQGE